MEMTKLSCEKFLAELGKLLTFMYEEDRQTALAMYNQLFDEVDDEQGLLQLLVSPTRQAVVIARSYNAKERKLQVHAQSREESDTASDGAAPEFMGVIESIREEALSRQAPKTAEVSADQFSMFEDDFFAPTPETPAAPAEAEPEAPAEEAAAPVAEAEVEAPAEASPAEAAETEAEAAEAEAPAPAASVDEVDAFIADFSIPADQQEFAPDAGEQTAPAEPAEPAQPEEAEAPAESDEDDSAPIVIEEEDDDEYDDEYYDDEEYEPVRKPRVFLLILYILLAVPVGLLGILLLIVPTLLFLVLAGLIITGGVMAVTSAFGSGIAVFADIMVIIGMAFILLALGLLALWIAVWLVGGAMVGLVRGLIHLGGKWCYKEVEA